MSVFSSFPRVFASNSSGSRATGATGVPKPGSFAGADLTSDRTADELDRAVKTFGAKTNVSYHEALSCLLGGPAELDHVAGSLAARTGMSKLRAAAVLRGEVAA